MALFRRKKSTTKSTVPTEVEDYYKAERRERTGIAWLLAIGTLLVTIFLAVVLFFGGRWLYRHFKNDNNTPQTVKTAQPNNNNANQKQAQNQSGSNQNSGSSSSESQPSSNSSTPQSSSGAGSTPPSSSSTPNTGPSSPEPLPRTGPDQDL